MIMLALAAASIIAGGKARKKQKKAARIQRDLNAMQASRQRKLALREYRLAKAAAISQISAAAEDSSALHGVKGSLDSQIQSNIEFSLKEEHMTGRIGAALDRASKLEFLSSALGVGANIAGVAKPLQQISSSLSPASPVPATPQKSFTPAPTTTGVRTFPYPYMNSSPFIPIGTQ